MGVLDEIPPYEKLWNHLDNREKRDLRSTNKKFYPPLPNAPTHKQKNWEK